MDRYNHTYYPQSGLLWKPHQITATNILAVRQNRGGVAVIPSQEKNILVQRRELLYEEVSRCIKCVGYYCRQLTAAFRPSPNLSVSSSSMQRGM